MWLSACGSGESSGGKPAASAGSSGKGSAGAAGGAGTVADAGASSSAGAAAGGATTSGGASAGDDAAGTGGMSSGGASAGGIGAGGAAGAATAGASAGGTPAAAGAANVPLDFFARYEAESALNTLTYPVERVGTEGAAACAQDGVKEGANCASGGKAVTQILGRSPCTPPTSTTSYDQCQNKGGGVTFNQVTVPADGVYDVTWWYHCGPDTPGHADVYGDTKCGGLDYGTGAGTGCRPHLIDVNGTPMSTTVGGKAALYYQFPCYTAPWSVLHGATTALPLKAGMNSIYIHAPEATTLDAVDVDALDVHAQGQGTATPPLWPKLVTPVVTGN
jgi:hypothetical protein